MLLEEKGKKKHHLCIMAQMPICYKVEKKNSNLILITFLSFFHSGSCWSVWWGWCSWTSWQKGKRMSCVMHDGKVEQRIITWRDFGWQWYLAWACHFNSWYSTLLCHIRLKLRLFHFPSVTFLWWPPFILIMFYRWQ